MSDENHLESKILTHRVVTVASFLVSAYYSIFYIGGRAGHDNHHSFHVGNTPFTANVFFIFTYWIVFIAFQVLFLLQFYGTTTSTIRSDAFNKVHGLAWHFTLFNLFHSLWAWLFVNDHFFLSELVVFLNFFNIMTLYVTHKPYAVKPISLYLTTHIPVAAFPLSWLLYTLFWNGAVLFHHSDAPVSLFARLLSNFLIWDFLIVPFMFLALYKDWGIGLTSSFLTWGIGVAQFFTKVVALQWVFAFIIASLTFLMSLAVLVPRWTPEAIENESSGNETAPLLQDNNNSGTL